MKLFVLTITFLLVQLSDQVNQNQSFYQASQFLMCSLQAAMNRAEAEYNLNEPYLWCPCTFDQYEEYYGFPYRWMDEDDSAWW